MEYCRNIPVSGGLPSEYQPEQVLSSSSCSKLGSLDDLFSGHNPEGDVSMEWLSSFVEDCFSNSGNCFPQIPPNQQLHHNSPSTTTTTSVTSPNQQLQKTTTTSIAAPKPPQKKQQKQEEQRNTSPTTPLHKFAIPGKARTKRKRTPVVTKPKPQITKWSQSHHLTTSSDPPLLHQSHWLADSELIVMPKTVQIEGQIMMKGIDDEDGEREMDEEEEERGRRNLEEGLMMIMSSHGQGGGQGQGQQQGRRCSHCLSQKTPQWRAGPLGPKTLCNACGVRYKSGRLLPEYRPAKSPTFVSFKHSNSHKKVMEMRNATNTTTPTSTTANKFSSSLLSKS